MSLKAALRNRPVIYEIVPPRRDTSRFNTELRGVEDVLRDSRIVAINIPELTNRKEQKWQVLYSPVTIPPEEYAMLIKEYKETIVNIIAPRLKKQDFATRVEKILGNYDIPNIVLVGKERHGDVLPGPSVPEALALIGERRGERTTVGGICIFTRNAAADNDYEAEKRLDEHRRVWLKARLGCDFVTSQINLDQGPAVRFLSSYQDLCTKTGEPPLTVFISLSTIPSRNIMSTLDRLDVVIPPHVRKRLLQSSDMGRESQRIATEVFQEITGHMERNGIDVPIGLHIEQVGVNSGDLSIRLLDATYPILRES